MENNLGSAAQEPGPRPSLFRRWRYRTEVWLSRMRRKLPYIVWYGDELDVGVCFSEARLAPDVDPGSALAALYPGRVFEAESALRDYGVTFDSGMGFEGRDWEWDWSLQGPVSVRFRGRARHPEKRLARPRPRLAVDNDAA